MTDLWNNDLIQFARLLCEIVATQEDLDVDELCESMDLEEDDIDELFERAHKVWERSKAEVAFERAGVFHEPIPADNDVQPIVGEPDHEFNMGRNLDDYPDCIKCDGPCTMPRDPVTCGTCHLTWDDYRVGAPSGRCPFEYFHRYPEEP